MRVSLKDTWLSVLVFLAGLLLTLTASYAVSENVRAQRKNQFDRYVVEMEQAIDRRIQVYTDMLIGARGLFSVEREISPIEWRRYVANLNTSERYPGIQGIGYATHREPGQLAAFQAHMRELGLTGYTIHPPGVRADNYPIQYLEPLDARNRVALGYDMFAEPTRHEAMVQARDTGRPATSDKVTLVQEITQDKQAGFLIYVPVYENGHRPGTVAARRQRIRGFVYSPFRAGDLFHGIFERQTVEGLNFSVYDGTEPRPENLLYESPNQRPGSRPAFESTVPISVPGHRWTMVVKAPPDFRFETADALPGIVFGGGLFVSLLLFSNTWVLASSRRRAVAIAEHMTSELREANVQLKAVDRSKDEFLSVISHELRTPLNFIMGFASILDDEVSGDLNPEQRRHVRKILDGAERMLTLVNDLLDVAKLQAGKFELAVESLDYAALVEEVLASMRPLADGKAITLTADLERPLRLVADPERLVQIISNLLSNAVKFTERGGRITVRAFEADGQVFTEVTDTGIGIAEADVPKLFTRFKQLDMSATRKAGGTGLGLTISKALVEAHGGVIGVRSRQGQGSTFWFALPASPAQ